MAPWKVAIAWVHRSCGCTSAWVQEGAWGACAHPRSSEEVASGRSAGVGGRAGGLLAREGHTHTNKIASLRVGELRASITCHASVSTSAWRLEASFNAGIQPSSRDNGTVEKME